MNPVCGRRPQSSTIQTISGKKNALPKRLRNAPNSVSIV